MTGVNTLFNGLLNTPGFAELDFSAVKVVVGGGAAVQKPVAERWKQVTGRYITEAYGLTETSPGVPHQSAGHAVERHASGCRFRRPRSRSATTISTSCRRGPARATSKSTPARSASAARR